MGNAVTITGSIPRLIHGNNFYPVNVERIGDVARYIVDRGKELGLLFNPASLTVSRIDLACNCELPYPPPLLIQQLSNVQQLGHMKQRVSSEFYNCSYVRWDNGEREFVVYDKTENMKKSGAAAIPPGNWVRSEARFMTGRSCGRAGLLSLDDLRDRKKQIESWKDMNLAIINAAKQGGIYGAHIIQPGVVQHIERTLTKRGGRTGEILTIIAGMGGIDSFLELYGGQAAFARLLPTLGLNRPRKHRILKTINRTIEESRRIKGLSNAQDTWGKFEEWITSVA